MRIAIAMPVCVRVPELEEMTLRCLRSVESDHELTLWLTVVRPPENGTTGRFVDRCRRAFRGEIIPRSTDGPCAAAWNWAFDQAHGYADRLCVLANDTELEPDAMDALAAYDGPADYWSGVATSYHPDVNPSGVTHGCDFSFAMTVPECWRLHGRFDENFKPAYHEDCDMAARVVLAGGDLNVVGAARFVHKGSQTRNLDPEMRFHCDHWWSLHERYYQAKWGTPKPVNDPKEMRERYYHHPFNDPTKPLSYWRPGHILEV